MRLRLQQHITTNNTIVLPGMGPLKTKIAKKAHLSLGIYGIEAKLRSPITYLGCFKGERVALYLSGNLR